MSILQPKPFGRTGQTHRSAVEIYIHHSGALGDLPGIDKEAQIAFLLLCSAPQEDVLCFLGQQFVPRNALALAQVNKPYSNTSHARYHKTQSHVEALSVCCRLVGNHDLYAYTQRIRGLQNVAVGVEYLHDRRAAWRAIELPRNCRKVVSAPRDVHS